MRADWTTVVGVLLLAASVSAQDVGTFEDLRLHLNVGDEAGVEDRSGAVTWGRVSRLAPEEIVVIASGGAKQVFSSANVRRVERRGDPPWDGLRWGGLTGAVLGCALFGAFSGEWRDGDCVGGSLFFTGVGMGIGLAIDAFRVGTTTVFVAPDSGAAPPHRVGHGVVVGATWTW